MNEGKQKPRLCFLEILFDGYYVCFFLVYLATVSIATII
jgi:hypothetical protein